MMPLTTNYFFGVKIVLLMHAPLHFQFITFNLVGNLLSTKLVSEGVDRSVKEKIKVPILKEVNFGKTQLCRVEHIFNIFVLT